MSNSDNLKDAATLLLKGGTLINDPCPRCSGLQVRFRDENICVAECQRFDSTNSPTQESIASDLSKVTLKEMIETIIKEKLVSIVQLLKQENDISEQKIKAELVEVYLRIIVNLRERGNID